VGAGIGGVVGIEIFFWSLDFERIGIEADHLTAGLFLEIIFDIEG
jgi:hypothetical protein